MSDRLVLAMDGSTRICSAALLRVSAGPASAALGGAGAAVGGEWSRASRRCCCGMVDEMLEEIGAQPADLGTIVVGIGPGTFTGVRIAVATARGLALALAVPVLGVSTLTALAACARWSSGSEEDRASWSQRGAVSSTRGGSRCSSPCTRPRVRVAAMIGARWTRRRPIGVCDQGSPWRGAGGRANGGSLR